MLRLEHLVPVDTAPLHGRHQPLTCGTSGKGLTALVNKSLLQGIKSSKLSFCEDCIYGRQKKVSFSSSSYHLHEILEYVHSNVWRPPLVQSLGGAKYFLTYVDD